MRYHGVARQHKQPIEEESRAAIVAHELAISANDDAQKNRFKIENTKTGCSGGLKQE